MSIQSVNPATEEVLAEFDEFSQARTDQALTEVHEGFREWRRCSLEERAGPLRRSAQYLRSNKARFAGMITAEMGKPIAESEAEIEKCAWNCEYYADEAPRLLAPRRVETNASESFYAYRPLGVILAIMPWNFPFWQVFRHAAPTLMAGNTIVLKHASNVPQCALAIEEVFQKTDFPVNVFRTLLIGSSAVAPVIDDERVAAVTLTGSEAVGSQVAAAAGKAIKKSVMELGGSDPFIVLEDADLAGAVELGVKSRYQNTGQSCIAAKRFIVVEEVADEFEQRFVDVVAKLRVGDPSDRDVRVGPLARGDLRDDLERQVQAAVSGGARLLQGGNALQGKGYFFQPTVLAEAGPGNPAFDEETFGPAAALVRARDADEAVDLANSSRYGLGGNLWTRDIERGKQLAAQIESGNVFINGMTASDPRLPFGGVKHSGFGRELSSFGIHEFTNIQTVWIGPAQGEQGPAAPSE